MDRLKIYFKNKPLYIIPKEEVKDFLGDSIVFNFENNPEELTKFINSLWHKEGSSFIITGEDFEKTKSQVLSNFKPVKAAGGVVIKDSDKVLIIYRMGKWDLPKGHWEPGETLADCALREVKEETNIDNITIARFFRLTYHSYILKDQLILKECHWYLMNHSGEESLRPQTEEEIQIVKWVPLNEIDNYLKNTHGNIRDTLVEVKNLLF